MIIFLQFTLTDLRAFTLEAPFVLAKPTWPSPKPFAHFVRGTGQIIQRRNSGLHGWVGEHYICKIGKNIRFQNTISLNEGGRIKSIFKHVYASENQVLNKYEFVFDVQVGVQQTILDYNGFRDIVHRLLSSKAEVKINGTFVSCRVNELQGVLQKLHFEASTSKLGRSKGNSHHILACTPQLYLVNEDDCRITGLDKNFKEVTDEVDGPELLGAWHDHKNKPFRLWVQRKLDQPELNRSLRMTIMRLHSEYECLRNIFQAIEEGQLPLEKETDPTDRLQMYLRKTIRTFLRAEDEISSQGGERNFLDYFSKIFSKAQPGELDGLIEKIKNADFRLAVEELTVNFIGNNNIEFMKNKFENKNSVVLSQGDNNEVKDNTINQHNHTLPDSTDYAALLTQIEELKAKAVSVAKSGDDFKGLAAIADAEEAAKKKDGSGVVKALLTGGKFVVDVASKFSASLLVEILKQHSTFI
jgi:hypothetical protein